MGFLFFFFYRFWACAASCLLTHSLFRILIGGIMLQVHMYSFIEQKAYKSIQIRFKAHNNI